ncbi:MAG: HNH endonuclease [Deltaproteobacteria bacterium]|nr:HNH endonuclease [Deltaproteobacteria bacterium]
MSTDRARRRGRTEVRAKKGKLASELDVPREEEVSREKEKARVLRRSAWWTRKVSEGVCHYCRRKVGSAYLTMDHVVPLSRGGKSRKGNLVPSCKECNNRKKSLLPLEWEEYVRRLAEEADLR